MQMKTSYKSNKHTVAVASYQCSCRASCIIYHHACSMAVTIHIHALHMRNNYYTGIYVAVLTNF